MPPTKNLGLRGGETFFYRYEMIPSVKHDPRAVLPRFRCKNNIYQKPLRSVTDHRGAKRGQKSAKRILAQAPSPVLLSGNQLPSFSKSQLTITY
jgi:hypothetical protein